MISGARIYPEAGHDGSGLWGTLRADVQVSREDDRVVYRLAGEIPEDWHLGMLVSDNDNGASFEAVVREVSPRHAQLELLTDYRHGASVWGVHAHDSRQNFTLNLLMDDDIDLVTIAGSAGTGKTFMTLAAAFQQTLDTKRFERVVFTRAPISMSEDIGYLPGTEEEKMSPGWVPFTTTWTTCCATNTTAAPPGTRRPPASCSAPGCRFAPRGSCVAEPSTTPF